LILPLPARLIRNMKTNDEWDYRPYGGYRNPTDKADEDLRQAANYEGAERLEDEILLRAAIITKRRAAEKRSQVAKLRRQRLGRVVGFVILIVMVPWFTIMGLFVSLTIVLPLRYVISDSAWDAISIRFDDGRIGLWTLPSMIPWVIIGWLEIGVAMRIWRGWQRKRDKAQAIEEEIRTVSEIKITEPQPWRIEQRFKALSEWLDRRAPFDPDERPFLFWIACLLMFCLLGVIFFWVSGVPLNNLGDFIGAIMIGYILTWCLLLILSLPYITWISLRWLRTWLAQNLPRGLVSRYRSWQLRRAGRRLRRDAAQELAENHIH
jgi:hypothetical protein